MDFHDENDLESIDQIKEVNVQDDATEGKFIRRSLVDRRKNTGDLGYKGHQRRKLIRRLKKDRRDGLRSIWFP